MYMSLRDTLELKEFLHKPENKNIKFFIEDIYDKGAYANCNECYTQVKNNTITEDFKLLKQLLRS